MSDVDVGNEKEGGGENSFEREAPVVFRENSEGEEELMEESRGNDEGEIPELAEIRESVEEMVDNLTREINDSSHLKMGFPVFSPFQDLVYLFKFKLYTTFWLELLVSFVLFFIFFFHASIFIMYLFVMVYLTPYDPNTIAVIINIGVMLLLFFIFLFWLFVSVNVWRKLSFRLEELFLRRKSVPEEDASSCFLFTLKFSILSVLEYLITFFLCILFSMFILSLPPLGIVLFAVVEGCLIEYFGLKVVFMSRNKYFEMFPFLLRNLPSVIGLCVGCAFLQLLPFLGFLAPIVSVVSTTKLYCKYYKEPSTNTLPPPTRDTQTLPDEEEEEEEEEL